MIDALTWRWSFPSDFGIQVDSPTHSSTHVCTILYTSPIMCHYHHRLLFSLMTYDCLMCSRYTRTPLHLILHILIYSSAITVPSSSFQMPVDASIFLTVDKMAYFCISLIILSRHYHQFSPSTHSSSHQFTVLAYLTSHPYHPHLYQLTTSCQLLLVTPISYHTSIRGKLLANL